MVDELAYLSMTRDPSHPAASNNPARPAYSMPYHPQADTLPTAPLPYIRFRHPAYSDLNNTLLRLPPLDHLDGGLHYDTALTACGIVAGNRFTEGHFRAERGGDRVEIQDNSILKGESYYFCVSDDMQGKPVSQCRINLPTLTSRVEKYAIVPTFAHWPFPHGKLPACWLAVLIPS
ncbi:MAG: hypothetical protein M1829_000195 [Trizodia sp. TS-e1964]|nr:MAG: hypothetical protein M1829_000195 [Trizodia sp. TS-e1964]